MSTAPPRPRRTLRALRGVPRCGVVSVSLCAAIAFLGAACVAVCVGVPTPNVHDEFSYLLAADTFASGRLTNPTHPLWEAFEGLQIIHRPSYASKYPPAQGLVLALAQVVFHRPIVGVWLGVAAMAGAVCWMLRAIVAPRWALIGGLLAALQFGVVGPWAQSYWGGAIAAAGGALLMGGVIRTMRRCRWRDAVLAGLGALVLANARPFEGLLFTLPIAVTLFAWLILDRRFPVSDRWLRGAAPIALVLICGAATMGFYNQRVTGHPLLMPYAIYEKTYATVPLLVIQSDARFREHPPRYTNERMKESWRWETARHMDHRSPAGLLKLTLEKARSLGWFYLAPALLAPLVLLPVGVVSSLRGLVRRRLRPAGADWIALLALASVTTCLAGSLLTRFAFSHYAAPLTGALILLVVLGLRRVSLLRLGNRLTGWYLVAMVIAITALTLVPGINNEARLRRTDWGEKRAALIAGLEAKGGKHLVIVREPADYNLHRDWVFNPADIDATTVIFARDIGREMTRRLLDYYKDRTVWVLTPEGIRAFPAE